MDYKQMERWAKWWANRYSWASESRGDIDREDLIQSAMVGILEALKSYDEGGSWAQWSSYFIRKEIRKLIGIKHGRLPPSALSLNDPVGEDGDSTMIDLLPDEDAPDALDVAEFNDLQRQVRAAVARLKDDQQREVVERTRLNGEPQRAVARDLGVSVAYVHSIWTAARKNLARDRHLRTLADSTPYYVHVGVNRFNSTWTSATELAALWRIDHEGGEPSGKREKPASFHQ